MRPERVNKWPNSVTDIWWWWYCYRIKELCINLVVEISLYYDARSKEHQLYVTLLRDDKISVNVLINSICWCPKNLQKEHVELLKIIQYIHLFIMEKLFLPRLGPNGSEFLLVFERHILQYKMPDIHHSKTNCCNSAELGGEIPPNTTPNSLIYIAISFSLFKIKCLETYIC